MRHAPRWAAAGLVGLCAAAAAAPPAPEPAPPPHAAPRPARPNVPQLVADLGSDDYRTREAAGRDLARVGIAAVPALRAAGFAADRDDVRRRAAVLARRIETGHLEAPTRITFAARQWTAQEVCAEVARQAGCRVEYDGPTGADAPRYDFDFENVPLLQAVDRVAEAAGASVDCGSESISVLSGGTCDAWVAYAGPFKFVAQQVQVSADVNLEAPRGRPAPRDEYIRVQYVIISEPKNPFFHAFPAVLVGAEDDRGRPLVAPAGRANRRYRVVRDGYVHKLQGAIDLRSKAAVDTAARSIKSLKGKVAVEMLAGVRPEIEIPNPLGADGQTFTGRTVAAKVERLLLGEANPGYVLDVAFTRLGSDPPVRRDSGWASHLCKRVELHDAAGNAYHTGVPTDAKRNPAWAHFTIPLTNRDPATGGPTSSARPSSWS
ncbi:Uncharacterized protein OS=Isosphaera pallida (strain ATCC 43644 / DSM 9630 / IS1B) GN=Isop_3205 PE=4 SV=1 [Gemmataceae bacterium]|nr:Uncharacterized protein OS=Isosphaera pallida (strain ATCC 43644 / DSM 9630 / IS1B) GN=Isop_3205 PE=4 SV=1 [Gemmataceae bacterium]VTT96788.1 Uncharacterized protein OS=Isosphaera pallida (strain ATCC 43644 / DSM 9630 / IS1B) GN=Isop_3205 PE=4 SV=1 [Gemmataceae bacterium]